VRAHAKKRGLNDHRFVIPWLDRHADNPRAADAGRLRDPLGGLLDEAGCSVTILDEHRERDRLARQVVDAPRKMDS
jgi:hypothetical protein